MKLKFEPVTEKNRAQALRLHGAPGQEGLVEPVEQCLAEAEQWKGWRPVLILDGERPVGFAMYGKFPLESFPFGRVWLDRLLIAGEHQGRGYGKAALAGLIQRLREEYRCKKNLFEYRGRKLGRGGAVPEVRISFYRKERSPRGTDYGVPLSQKIEKEMGHTMLYGPFSPKQSGTEAGDKLSGHPGVRPEWRISQAIA